jgi:hypothetical protein
MQHRDDPLLRTDRFVTEATAERAVIIAAMTTTMWRRCGSFAEHGSSGSRLMTSAP